MSKKTIPITKVCPACGKEFLVCPEGHSSRSYPPNWTVCCSRECAFQSRFRRSQACNDLSTPVAAYIAGFLDGEGSVVLYGRAHETVALRVVFSSCNRAVLEWLLEQVGMGSIVTKPTYSLKHATAYLAQLNGLAAPSLLIQLLPYLHIKTEQARLAIDFYARLKDPALKADRSWQQVWRAKMQALNARGPKTLTTGSATERI